MKIRKVACIGVGQVGHGWAITFCLKGLKVILWDLTDAILDKAVQNIGLDLGFLEQRGLVRRDEVEAALKRIDTTTNISKAVSNVDYVQESIIENYDDKKRVFKEMDANAPEQTILASSSSALLMTEIQKATTRPERCVIVHPMLPTHLMPLVEIVGGNETSRETVERAYDFMLKMGKVPVVLKKEVYGYIVNRLQAALLREAIDLIEKGVASAEEIDRAFTMGIGVRGPILGPCLRAYLAGGGSTSFIKKFGQSYNERWKTMSAWTSLTRVRAEKFIKSVNEIEIVRTKSLDEINRWRDEKLLEILKTLGMKL